MISAEHRATGVAEEHRFPEAERIIAPVEGQRVVTLSYVCPLCHGHPLEDHIWWVSMEHCDSSRKGKKQCNWWYAACGGQYSKRDPSRESFFSGRCGSQRSESVSGHAPAQGVSCVHSNCWPTCNLVETTWWTRSSRVCRSKAGSKSRVSLSRWPTTRR